jgi:hypothetical protein
MPCRIPICITLVSLKNLKLRYIANTLGTRLPSFKSKYIPFPIGIPKLELPLKKSLTQTERPERRQQNVWQLLPPHLNFGPLPQNFGHVM